MTRQELIEIVSGILSNQRALEEEFELPAMVTIWLSAWGPDDCKVKEGVYLDVLQIAVKRKEVQDGGDQLQRSEGPAGVESVQGGEGVGG